MYKENVLMVIANTDIDEIEEKININARSKIFYPEDSCEFALILIYIYEMNDSEKEFLKQEFKLKDEDFNNYRIVLLYI